MFKKVFYIGFVILFMFSIIGCNTDVTTWFDVDEMYSELKLNPDKSYKKYYTYIEIETMVEKEDLPIPMIKEIIEEEFSEINEFKIKESFFGSKITFRTMIPVFSNENLDPSLIKGNLFNMFYITDEEGFTGDIKEDDCLLFLNKNKKKILDKKLSITNFSLDYETIDMTFVLENTGKFETNVTTFPGDYINGNPEITHKTHELNKENKIIINIGSVKRDYFFQKGLIPLFHVDI